MPTRNATVLRQTTATTVTRRRNRAELREIDVPRLGQLRILHARYTEHAFAPHSHPDHYLVAFVLSGDAVFVSASGPRRLSPGEIVVARPGESHHVHGVGGAPWEYCEVHLHRALVIRLVAERLIALAEDGEVAVVAHPDPRRAIARAVGGLGQLQLDEDDRSAVVDLARAMADCTWPAPRVLHTPATVTRAHQALTAAPCSDWSTARLAAVAAMSQFHFIRAFRAVYGITPYAYVSQVRAEEAVAALLHGLSTRDVVRRCGFTDESHLIRQVKRVMGVTPSQIVSTASHAS